jgi:CO dehydrogenase maturation factor
VRGLLGDILTEQYQLTVADMEAGLEHMSRSDGTIAFVDAILVVLEPYRKALETSRRTIALASELGIPHILGVGSKVRDDEDIAMLQSFVNEGGPEIAAFVPYDDAARQADRDGTAVLDLAPEGPAVRAVDELLDIVIDVASNGEVLRTG